jgi:hypothetical protein
MLMVILELMQLLAPMDMLLVLVVRILFMVLHLQRM